MLQTNAGRGARCVDWARRAQIAAGVRGPRADASESTRRAVCAPPCLSTHVTVGPPVSSLSAWRRRAMQPGGVSAIDTRSATQDLTASVCGFCASWEFPECCDASVRGDVERRWFDHAVELETEDVIVGQVRARSKRAVRAGLWVPEDEAGVPASEDETAVGQRHHVADVVFFHACVAPRVVVPEGPAVPNGEAAGDVVSGGSPAGEPDPAVCSHRDRLDGDDVALRGNHEDGLVAVARAAGASVRIAEGDGEDLVSRPVQPIRELRCPADLAAGPAAADPEVAVGRERQALPVAEAQVALRGVAGVVVADLGMEVIGEPLLGGGKEPLAFFWRAVFVRPDAVHSVVGSDVQLVRVLDVVVEHPLDGAVVPELRGIGGHQVQSIDLEASRAGQPDPIELPAMAIRIAPVRAPIVDAEVADEHLALGAPLDLADARIGRGPEDRTPPVPSREVRVAVLDPIALQMQPVADGEAPEGPLAGLHQVQRRVGGHPEVLRLVGGRADHRLLEDTVAGDMDRVCCAPGAGATELGARAAQKQRAATRRREQYGDERFPQGSTLRIATTSVDFPTFPTTPSRPRLHEGPVLFARGGPSRGAHRAEIQAPRRS